VVVSMSNYSVMVLGIKIIPLEMFLSCIISSI
jgi:hypothetical protein